MPTITIAPTAMHEYTTTIPHPHGPLWDDAVASALDTDAWVRDHVEIPHGWVVVSTIAISKLPITASVVRRVRKLASFGLGQRAIAGSVRRSRSVVQDILAGSWDDAPDHAPERVAIRVRLVTQSYLDRTTLHAPPSVYAVAQLGGLRTDLDTWLVADHNGIQYYDSAGQPTRRECFHEGRESLPDIVLRDLDRLRSIDRLQSIGGHMRGRPDTARAQLVASRLDKGDSSEREKIRARLAAWVESQWPQVLAEDRGAA